MRWSAAQTLGWIIRGDPRDLGSWTTDMGPELKNAETELAKAIGAERVRAWGRLDPDSPVRQIDGSNFRHSGLVVEPGGELATRPPRYYKGERFKFIEFDEDEVKRAFIAPPPTDAKEWMLDEAKRLQALGRKGKRADMVRDCMRATGCRKRVAEAAHGTLPPEFRRPRGKSPKLAG